MPKSEQLILTKFSIPQLTGDHVVRTHLMKKLDGITDHNLTLVSAPSGYGKSTLIASWLMQQSLEVSWLSLDEEDNAFFKFLRYFIGALRLHKRSFGDEVIQLIESSQPPTSDHIIGNLMNDLANIGGSFIIVLDDFQFISDEGILDLLQKLIKHPVPWLHLILITRSDPNFPLFKWRLGGRLLEIRTRDFFLENEEAGVLMRNRFGVDPEEELVNVVLEFTHGWISGVKILLHTVRDYDELKGLLESHSGTDIFKVSYYLETYINSLSETVRKKVLMASLFSEFNAGLCEYVCSDEETDEQADKNDGFIVRLLSDGMFIIPLDTSSRWYRFHHFFRDFLLQILKKEIQEEDIIRIHSRASRWFERKEMAEMAIRHAIWAEDETRALELFSSYRIGLLGHRKWNEHESLLRLFSEEKKAHSEVLLISRSWIYIYHGKMREAFQLISDLDAKFNGSSLDSSQISNLQGELNTIQAYDAYYKGDGKLAEKKSKLAIELLHPENQYPLGLAWIFLGGGFQIQKRTDEILPLLYEKFNSIQQDNVRASILHVVCYIHWLNGNLADLKVSALKLIELGTHLNNYESRTTGHVFAAYYYYETDQLEHAKEHFLNVYESRFHILGSVRIHAIIGLIITCFELEEVDQAFTLLKELEGYIAGTGNSYMINLATLTRAELEFRSGKMESAFQLTRNIGTMASRPYTNFFAPDLCMAKIWIYYGLPICTGEVTEILDRTERHLSHINNRRFLIDVYALTSMLHYDQGQQEESFRFITKAVKLARTGGFVRAFLDMGEKIKEILQASPYAASENAYVNQILSGFKKTDEVIPSDDLSDREHQILQYLSEKLTNKEIGARLFITEKTVKNHLNSIYRKLGASGRREALLKAKQGMLL